MIAPNLRLTFDEVEYTGVEILGAKADGTTDVYTFHPAQTVEASGDPQRRQVGPGLYSNDATIRAATEEPS